MTFDSLINVKLLETEIFDRVAVILQKNFLTYKNMNVCLTLDVADGDYSAVKQVRFFDLNNKKDMTDRFEFIFRGEFKKAYLITKFMDGFYEMSLHGHFTLKVGDVYPHEVKYVHILKSDTDRVLKKRLPDKIYELAAAGFKGIEAELKKKIV